jgi:hypothetical protein
LTMPCGDARLRRVRGMIFDIYGRFRIEDHFHEYARPGQVIRRVTE